MEASSDRDRTLPFFSLFLRPPLLLLYPHWHACTRYPPPCTTLLCIIMHASKIDNIVFCPQIYAGRLWCQDLVQNRYQFERFERSILCSNPRLIRAGVTGATVFRFTALLAVIQIFFYRRLS